MSFDKKTGNCFCERCGNFWTCRESFQNNRFVFLEPKSCAKCKSKVWNSPRVYGGKYLAGLAPMAKRFKPTGRQAANLRPEKIRAEKIANLKQQLKYAKYEYNKIQDQLADPEHWKYDRQSLGYFFNQYSNIIKDLKAEIEELEKYNDLRNLIKEIIPA